MSTKPLIHNLFTGEPLRDELVIDAHMHVGKYYNFLMPSKGIPALIENARRIGITRLYGSSLLSIRNDAIAGNRMVIEAHETYPNVFFPYLVVKPNYPEETKEILDLAKSRNIKQFKIHDDGNAMTFDHPNYSPLYEYANDVGAVILAHTYGDMHVGPLTKVAREFHSLKILLGHSGITNEDSYYIAVRSFNNIFLETCNSLAGYGLIERLVRNAGAERVCFGTDMPFMSPDQQIGRILGARITDDEKRQILGLNAQELFSAESD